MGARARGARNFDDEIALLAGTRYIVLARWVPLRGTLGAYLMRDFRQAQGRTSPIVQLKDVSKCDEARNTHLVRGSTMCRLGAIGAAARRLADAPNSSRHRHIALGGGMCLPAASGGVICGDLICLVCGIAGARTPHPARGNTICRLGAIGAAARRLCDTQTPSGIRCIALVGALCLPAAFFPEKKGGLRGLDV